MPTKTASSRHLTRRLGALPFAALLAACPISSSGVADGGPDAAAQSDGAADDAGDGGSPSSPDAARSDGGRDDAGESHADASDHDVGPRFPEWPPIFISAFGLSLDGPVADGNATWIELTVASPAGLASLGSWSLSTANFSYVTLELTSAEVPFALAAGDVLRVHGAGWNGVRDQQKADNHPGAWDISSSEPFGPSLKHGLLWLHAPGGRILDAVAYETGLSQGDWLEADALVAAQEVVAAGEWPTTDASAAVVLGDADRDWARLAARHHEGDSAADWQVVGSTLETYYESATGKTGAPLKAVLHEILKDHVVFPYSEVSSIFTATDADPGAPGNVIDFYTGRSTKSDFNKEHVWAKSHGGFESDAYAGFSDLHALRPARPDVNSARWHLDFDEGGLPYSDSGCKIVDGYSFEPRDAVKGDVARALFYMAVRYEGDDPPMPDLEFAEVIPSLLNAQGQPDNNQHTSTPRIGRLSTLLRWHHQDPPDDRERARNEVIFRDYQRNRNPFVDHPEWAAAIWGP